MTKEEKIQEAYGEHWQYVKDHVDKNGWVNAYQWLGGCGNTRIYHEMKDIELHCLDSYHRDYCYRFIPKSLQGIEENNGWIKIESEDDLPKCNSHQNYMVCENGIPKDYPVSCQLLHEAYKLVRLTHYQPITIAEKPIY